MTELIVDVVASYLESRTATNEICNALGTPLERGVNLFLGFMPDEDYDSVTLIPYSGSPPEQDGYRQNPSIQINVRSTSRATALKTGQALINQLHENDLKGKGKMIAGGSSPMLFKLEEGEEWVIAVTNFDLKHIKV